MTTETALREHLVKLLTSAWAHVTAEDGIAGVPAAQRGARRIGHRRGEIERHRGVGRIAARCQYVARRHHGIRFVADDAAEIALLQTERPQGAALGAGA